MPEGDALEFLRPRLATIAARSPLQLFWRRFRQDRVALASLVFIVFLIVVAIAAPLVVEAARAARPVRAEPQPDRRVRLAARAERRASFGVDELGQDVMSRVIYGTRVSLEVGDHRHRRSRR